MLGAEGAAAGTGPFSETVLTALTTGQEPACALPGGPPPGLGELQRCFSLPAHRFLRFHFQRRSGQTGSRWDVHLQSSAPTGPRAWDHEGRLQDVAGGMVRLLPRGRTPAVARRRSFRFTDSGGPRVDYSADEAGTLDVDAGAGGATWRLAAAELALEQRAAGAVGVPNLPGLATDRWTTAGVDWAVSASSSWSASQPPYLAFNGRAEHNGTKYEWGSAEAYSFGGEPYAGTWTNLALQGQWLQLESPLAPQVLVRYKFACSGPANFPRSWTIAGSNDGSTWYRVHSASAGAGNNPFTTANTTQTTPFRVALGGTQVLEGQNAVGFETTTYPDAHTAFTHFKIVFHATFYAQSVGIGEFFPEFVLPREVGPNLLDRLCVFGRQLRTEAWSPVAVPWMWQLRGPPDAEGARPYTATDGFLSETPAGGGGARANGWALPPELPPGGAPEVDTGYRYLRFVFRSAPGAAGRPGWNLLLTASGGAADSPAEGTDGGVAARVRPGPGRVLTVVRSPGSSGTNGGTNGGKSLLVAVEPARDTEGAAAQDEDARLGYTCAEEAAAARQLLLGSAAGPLPGAAAYRRYERYLHGLLPNVPPPESSVAVAQNSLHQVDFSQQNKATTYAL